MRWIAVAGLCVLTLTAGLFVLRSELRGSPECGGGFACPAGVALDADASEYCRNKSREALALVLVTDTDPYHIARAYGSKHAFGDMAWYVTMYWGCLDGLGIAAKPPAKFLSPTW